MKLNPRLLSQLILTLIAPQLAPAAAHAGARISCLEPQSGVSVTIEHTSKGEVRAASHFVSSGEFGPASVSDHDGIYTYAFTITQRVRDANVDPTFFRRKDIYRVSYDVVHPQLSTIVLTSCLADELTSWLRLSYDCSPAFSRAPAQCKMEHIDD